MSEAGILGVKNKIKLVILAFKKCKIKMSGVSKNISLYSFNLHKKYIIVTHFMYIVKFDFGVSLNNMFPGSDSSKITKTRYN